VWAPAKSEKIVVKKRPAPERPDLTGEVLFMECFLQDGAQWEIKRCAQIPGNGLRKFFGETGQPEPPVSIARAITNQERSVRRDRVRELQ
jgi:hypothetical protein